MKIAIIGLGRMGTAQARLARIFNDEILFAIDNMPQAVDRFASHFNVTASHDIHDPRLQPLWSQTDLLWLTVTDNQLAPASAEIAPMLCPKTIVLHTSGATSSREIADNLPHNPCASFHPLLPCPPLDCTDEECRERFEGIYHTIEGNETACKIAEILAERIHAKIVKIHNKPLYHAAACFAAVYPLTIMQVAANLFVETGFSPEQALEATRQVMACSLRNAQDTPPLQAMTGPAKRGDSKTLQKHKEVLASNASALELYNALLKETQKLLNPGK